MHTESIGDMIYVMSNEDKSKQLGQLMLDKQASERRLAELKLSAKNFAINFAAIARGLDSNPELLGFPQDSVDTRFRGIQWLADGRVATGEEVKAVVNAIRAEQIKLWGYEESLHNLGF